MRQPDFVSPTEEPPVASPVPQCSLTPLMIPTVAIEKAPAPGEPPTAEAEYKLLAEWKRGVKLRNTTEETSSLDKVLSEYVVNRQIKTGSHAQVAAEVARHLAVLQDTSILTHDNATTEMLNVGDTLDTLLGRAADQHVHNQKCVRQNSGFRS